jgi:hypothetical protein
LKKLAWALLELFSALTGMNISAGFFLLRTRECAAGTHEIDYLTKNDEKMMFVS